MARKSVMKLQYILEFFGNENKLIQKGENAYESQHVISVLFDDEVGVIKAKVHASVKDKVYEVQVEFNRDGAVKKGECSCHTGQVRCHHMAATLIYAHHNISVTDKGCGWTKRKEELSRTVTVDELFCNPEKTPYVATTDDVSDEKMQLLNEKLKSNYIS